jgi:hypothetical protein
MESGPFHKANLNFILQSSSGDEDVHLNIFLNAVLKLYVKPFSQNSDIYNCGPVQLQTIAPDFTKFNEDCISRVKKKLMHVLPGEEFAAFRPFVIKKEPIVHPHADHLYTLEDKVMREKEELSEQALMWGRPSILLAEAPAYTTYKYTAIQGKEIESRIDLEKLTITFNDGEDESQTDISPEEISLIDSKFEMEFICRYILLYHFICQESLSMQHSVARDTAWTTDKACRTVLLNIFFMVLGIMTGKHCSIDNQHLSRKPGNGFARRGTGPLDYLLSPANLGASTAASALFLKDTWKTLNISERVRSPGDLLGSNVSLEDFTAAMNAMQQQVDAIQSQCTPPTASSSYNNDIEATSSAVKETCSLLNVQTATKTQEVADVINNALIQKVAAAFDEDSECHSEVVICQVRSAEKTVTDEEEDEEEEDDEIYRNLNASLGQLAMQMVDCFNLHSKETNDVGNPAKRQRTSSKPVVVKGILTSFQMSLFFEMTQGADPKRPCFKYLGMARINAPPNQEEVSTRVIGSNMNLTIEEVRSFLIKHYVFINRGIAKAVMDF